MFPLKNYRTTNKNIWQGRIDDPKDFDSFRWHQLIKLTDLSKDNLKPTPKKSKNFCFLGFCCDKGVKQNLGRTGTSEGPQSIRREMSNLPCSFDKDTKIFDAGDIHCSDDDLNVLQNELAQATKKIFSLNLFPIILGGGHEISLGHFQGILNSLSGFQNPKIGIINFDAHFDLRPFQKESSSGTMFLQIADMCKEKNIDFSYFCLGIQMHGNTKSLFKKADSLKVQYELAKDINDFTLVDIFDKLNRFIKKHDYIYLTVCADVFSSAYAPGVSSPQPFGLHPEIVLKLLKHIIGSKTVVSFDIAEVSPRFDEDQRTAKLAAIILFAVINSLSKIELKRLNANLF